MAQHQDPLARLFGSLAREVTTKLVEAGREVMTEVVDQKTKELKQIVLSRTGPPSKTDAQPEPFSVKQIRPEKRRSRASVAQETIIDAEFEEIKD